MPIAPEPTKGVSATGPPAHNLRGIDIHVEEGAEELRVKFGAPEADAPAADAAEGEDAGDQGDAPVETPAQQAEKQDA